MPTPEPSPEREFQQRYGDEAFSRLLQISERVDDNSSEDAQALAIEAREGVYALERLQAEFDERPRS